MSIEKAYDAWSRQYDTNENKTRDLDVKATKETLSKYKFEHVIELGCGTGKNTRWLLSRAKSVIAFDFSQEMLNVAKLKKLNGEITFIKADLTQVWDVQNESVDLVTSSLTLEHIADLDHIFSQANMKLSENGLFFISELHPFKQYSGSGAKYEHKKEVVELEVYTHHITDYTNHAINNGFQLLEIREWFDDKDKTQIPRLISFVFRKSKTNT